MTKVIALVSAKGGSGKTLLSQTLATLLAALDYSVLLVDTDASTNGLTLLNLQHVVEHRDSHPDAAGIFERRGRDLENVDLTEIATGIFLLPSTYQFSDTEDTTVEQFAMNLSSTLAAARNEFDFVIVDAQAGADHYARETVQSGISDSVVIVSEYDPISAAGVERLKSLFGQSLSYERTWVLLNKVLPEFAKNFREFMEIARYASPIPWDAEVARAWSRRSLALELEVGNEHTVAVLRMARMILPEVSPRLDEWVSTRGSFLRESIDELINAASVQLKRLDLERRYEYSSRRRNWATIASIGMGLLGVLSAAGVTIFVNTSTSSSSSTPIVALGVTAIGLIGIVFLASVRFIAPPSPSPEAPARRVERQRLEDRIRKLQELREMDPEDQLRLPLT